MLLDLHNHTSECSQCANIAAEVLALRYSTRHEIDGFCVTDHLSAKNERFLAAGAEYAWPEVVERLVRGYLRSAAAATAAKVFFGIEYGVGYNDYLIYGLEAQDLLQAPYLREYSLEALLRLRTDFPCVAIVQAHPFRRRCFVAPQFPLDAIEVYNGMFFHDAENEAARQYARQHAAVAIAGTDCHEDDVGRMMTRFERPVASNADLALAIRANHIAGFYIKDIARDVFVTRSEALQECAPDLNQSTSVVLG